MKPLGLVLFGNLDTYFRESPSLLKKCQGVALLLARDVGQVRDVLRQSDTTDDATSRRVFATVEEAVEAATALRSGNSSQTSTRETP